MTMSEQENTTKFRVVCDDCGMEGEECIHLPVELMTLAVFLENVCCWKCGSKALLLSKPTETENQGND